MTYADSYVGCIYSALAGGFYNLHFAKILEFQVKAMAGYAWSPNILAEAAHTANYRLGSGVSLGAGVSLSLITGNNFMVKAFALAKENGIKPPELEKEKKFTNFIR